MNEKERAILWIERELRFLREAPLINGCEMKPEWAEQIDVWEAALDALKTVLDLENKGGENNV